MHPRLRNLSKDLVQFVLLRDHFIWRKSGARADVVLTFDDGPDPTFTPRLLELLAHHQVHATFFFIGSKIAEHRDLVRAVHDAGHQVASHSFDHRVIPGRSVADLAEDLGSTRALILAVTGQDTALFRPPKGEVDWTGLRRVARLGYRVVHWTKTYGDYRSESAEALLQRLDRTPPAAGDILLFHDHNQHTLDALGAVLPKWLQSGLRFATL